MGQKILFHISVKQIVSTTKKNYVRGLQILKYNDIMCEEWKIDKVAEGYLTSLCQEYGLQNP